VVLRSEPRGRPPVDRVPPREVVRPTIVDERSAFDLQALAFLVGSILTGVFVIPLVPYLNALSLSRDELIQALGLSLLTSAAAVAVALAREGALPVSLLGASLAAFAPAGLGALLGQRLRRRTHPAIFVRFFLVGLLAIGLHLAVRNLI